MISKDRSFQGPLFCHHENLPVEIRRTQSKHHHPHLSPFIPCTRSLFLSSNVLVTSEWILSLAEERTKHQITRSCHWSSIRRLLFVCLFASLGTCVITSVSLYWLFASRDDQSLDHGSPYTRPSIDLGGNKAICTVRSRTRRGTIHTSVSEAQRSSKWLPEVGRWSTKTSLKAFKERAEILRRKRHFLGWIHSRTVRSSEKKSSTGSQSPRATAYPYGTRKHQSWV